jgi:hypothetical protein
MRLRLGAIGPETTVDQMLEGRGHTVMLPAQLLDLLHDMRPAPAEVELAGSKVPIKLIAGLLSRGYAVRLYRP